MLRKALPSKVCCFSQKTSYNDFDAKRLRYVRGYLDIERFLPGYDNTDGLAQFLFDPMRDDCAYIKAMRFAGAIPFVSGDFSFKGEI